MLPAGFENSSYNFIVVNMKKVHIFTAQIAIFFLLVAPVLAAKEPKAHLTQEQVERVKALRTIVAEVDTKSTQGMVQELEKAPHPLLNLEIKEAIAKAYDEIARNQNIKGQTKKEWLYSMIALNMAYLQFNGFEETSEQTSPLNALIRRTLKSKLPLDIFTRPGFYVKLE